MARRKEVWTHEISEGALFEALRTPWCRITIGFFDAWAMQRAAELGLRLLATDDFSYWRDEMRDCVTMRGTVLVEDSGGGRELMLDGEGKAMQDMGVVPYIRHLDLD